jgi:phosphatidylglycerol lysyltransferase
VLAYGWNATAYQILNPGIEHWFAAAGDGVVGFVSRRGVRVVAGAPVCPESRLPAISEEFARDATRAGEGVCYFGAETRLERVCRDDARYAPVLLGAQPVWEPARWPELLATRATIRAQLNRARNKGVRVTRWPSDRATGDPGLARCLAEWLMTRGLPPLHFLVEPAALHRLEDRRIFAAEKEGRVVAYLVASPVPAREGWLIEQIVRGREAPNGTAELLVDAAMRAAFEDGSGYATLGMVPLSRRADVAPFDNPVWLRTLLRWARAHGRRFYNFDGLDAFKAKFRPVRWDPVFAIARARRFTPGMLHAVLAAFTQGSLALAVVRGLAHAAAMEFRGFTGAARSRPA